MAPDTSGRPLRVLYICGWGRSGTTVIDRVLGELDGFLSTGELRSLWDVDPGTHRCGCGETVADCPVWGPALTRALGQVDAATLRAMGDLRRHATRTRHIPALRPRRSNPTATSDISRYGDRMADLYRALAHDTGAEVVVDSSKHPADALLLASRRELDVTVLHLVRDPRGVAYSWKRRGPGAAGTAGGSPPQRGVFSSSAWWTTWNVLAERLIGKDLGDRYFRLRYEDLMAAPEDRLGPLLAHYGRRVAELPFAGPHAVTLSPSHTVAGNPNRADSGVIELALDVEWQDQMTKADRALASIPALPMLRHYGYPLWKGDAAGGHSPAEFVAQAARSGRQGVLATKRTVQRAVRAPGDRARSAASDLPAGYARVYHHHVRKTGGTSLNRAFLALGGEDPATVHWRMRGALHATRSSELVFVAHDQPLLRAGHYFYGWDHAPAWSIDLPARTFTVTVLRDPTARVVSLFRYLADARADDNEPFPAGRRERRSAARGFGPFLDELAKSDALNQLHMFSPTYSTAEAADAIRSCSAWFMTEDYDQGVLDLGQQLNLQLAPRWDRRSKGSADVIGPFADRLAELLAPEYDLLHQLEADPGHRIGALLAS